MVIIIKINGCTSYEYKRIRNYKKRNIKKRSWIDEKKVFKFSNLLGGQRWILKIFNH